MTISKSMLNQVAERFLELEAEGKPIEPVALLAPDLNADEAFQIQRLIINKLVAAGDTVIGKKAGVTTEAGQAHLGLTEPAYGHLLQGQQVADGGTISIAKLIRPVVECEITFRLGRDLIGPGVTPGDVIAATDSLVASLEIVDFRSHGLKLGMPEVLAYNVFAAHFVLGANPIPVDDLDLVNLAVTLKKNDQEIVSGTGATVLGDPTAAVAWLANKAAQHGVSLKAGEIILSGTMTAPQPVQAGDRLEATFEKLGSVSVRFE